MKNIENFEIESAFILSNLHVLKSGRLVFIYFEEKTENEKTNKSKYNFYLQLKNNSGKWVPIGIFHSIDILNNSFEICDYCLEEKSNFSCKYFNGYEMNIFEKLKMHPNIRLKWLKYENMHLK